MKQKNSSKNILNQIQVDRSSFISREAQCIPKVEHIPQNTGNQTVMLDWDAIREQGGYLFGKDIKIISEP